MTCVPLPGSGGRIGLLGRELRSAALPPPRIEEDCITFDVFVRGAFKRIGVD